MVSNDGVGQVGGVLWCWLSRARGGESGGDFRFFSQVADSVQMMMLSFYGDIMGVWGHISSWSGIGWRCSSSEISTLCTRASKRYYLPIGKL